MIWNTSLCRIFFVELTVAFHDNPEQAKERKLDRYLNVHQDCETASWFVSIETTEIGSRGVMKSNCFDFLKRFLVQLGMNINHIHHKLLPCDCWFICNMDEEEQYALGR